MSGDWFGKMIAFDFGDNIGVATFDPRCPKCNRFVKCPKRLAVKINGFDEVKITGHFTCGKCGGFIPEIVEYV